MPRIGPGAAGTIEALGMVHRQQRGGTLDQDTLLAQRLGRGVQGAPATGRRTVGCELRHIPIFMIGVVGL